MPDTWQIGTDPLEFVVRFRQRFGRAPRILHIGNIANYAYLNAKIQRGYGVEADCVDPNFYHIMASPEWLEAPLKGEHEDDFAPKWSKIDLGGYKRPSWFAQGNETLIFSLLMARARGQRWNTAAISRQLEVHRRLFTNDTPLPDDLFQRLVSGQGRIVRGLRRLAKRLLIRKRAAASSPGVAAASSHQFAVDPPEEVLHYLANAASFRPALETYDIIQGYTVQSIYPAVAGLPNFLSYELGTIRGLPFEDSPMGRLTRWVYLMSPEVFVTNIDCLDAAERMGIPADRINKALHAFDLDEAVAFSRSWSEKCGSVEPVFYAPARQHWKHGNESILKGNDVAIRGAALLKARGRKFKLVLGEWGSEVDLSKSLIAELGIEDCIEWTKPLPRHVLWPTYMRSCAVVDQFRSPAFGGVSLEAMALGKRLITGYDHSFGQHYFSEPPPIMNSRNAQAVAAAMEACMDDPHDSTALGSNAQEWMLREHSVERQLRSQFAVYERLLSKLVHRDGRWIKPHKGGPVERPSRPQR
jgi:glycosyltransferase involved in cell wall biosynthesis